MKSTCAREICIVCNATFYPDARYVMVMRCYTPSANGHRDMRMAQKPICIDCHTAGSADRRYLETIEEKARIYAQITTNALIRDISLDVDHEFPTVDLGFVNASTIATESIRVVPKKSKKCIVC